MFRKIIQICMVCLWVSSCQTALDLPVIRDNTNNSPITGRMEQRTIAFDGGLFDLKRGDLYVAYPYWRWSVPNVNVGFYVCNPTLKYRLARSQGYWDEDDNIFGRWPEETGSQIEDALANAGYRVKQHRQSYFTDKMNRPKAELLLSARITDIKLNLCHIYAPISLSSMERAGGEGVVTVEWEVYDAIRDKIIGSYVTQGYGHVDEPLQSGDKAVFIAAMRQAATQLSKTEWFKKVMTTMDPVDLIPKSVHRKLTLTTRVRPFHQPLRQHFYQTRKAVLSVRAEGQQIGSGFFIGNDGYALTTAGVVGDAEWVQITDAGGTKYKATVIRKDDRRDVALIKADVQGNAALPIGTDELPEAMTTVYTLGTPYQNSYRATVTQGMVSTQRFWANQGLNFIQADIPTAPGCSGSALTDSNGNVIGLAKSIASDASETHFSLFIPIGEALQALNIKIERDK